MTRQPSTEATAALALQAATAEQLEQAQVELGLLVEQPLEHCSVARIRHLVDDAELAAWRHRVST